MSLQVDWEGLGVGDVLRLTARGEPFVGLLGSDFEGWLDSMLDEVEDSGARYGLEFARLSEVVDSIADGVTRVTGILEVVDIDAEIAEQRAAVFGWVVLIVFALLSAPIAYNVAVRGEESLDIVRAGIAVTGKLALAAIIVALALVALRLLPGK